MKINLPLILLVAISAGCSAPQASPIKPIKRLPNREVIDEHYLKEVFVPSYKDESSKSALSNSVSQLETHLDEFRGFMHQVEDGKIPVTQGFKGNWQSYVKNDGFWIVANYAGQNGMILGFQKHKNQNPFPLIYGFGFSPIGNLMWVTTKEDGFTFDEDGRVTNYWHDKK
jgi:hypothetical protein